MREGDARVDLYEPLPERVVTRRDLTLSERQPSPAWQIRWRRRLLWVALAGMFALAGVQLGQVQDPEPGDLRTDPAIGMRFRYIPAGTFQMGSPEREAGRFSGEQRHKVTLTQGYWMGETEVTQNQWQSVMGSRPWRFSNCGPTCPLESVSWYQAVAFANALSLKARFEPCYAVSGKSGNVDDDLAYESVELRVDCTGYRLPTEAEWERAARTDTEKALYSGNLTIKGLNHGPELAAIAWYGGNSRVGYQGGADCSGWIEKEDRGSKTCGPHPTGKKNANAWGLSDMLGNVGEWTWDLRGAYTKGAQVDPKGPDQGPYRVIRGGAWTSFARYVRAAYRGGLTPSARHGNVGFRLARDQWQESETE